MSECKCNYHLGMGPNLKCPKHGEQNWKELKGLNSTKDARGASELQRLVSGTKQNMAEQLEEMLQNTVPESDLNRLTRNLHPDGSETFNVDGEPIIKLGPLKTEVVTEGETVKMKIHRDVKKYR